MERKTYLLFITSLLLELLIPSNVYLQSTSASHKLLTGFNYTRSSALVTTLANLPQQSGNLLLLGSNNETQPVINEEGSIKLKLTDKKGNVVSGSAITFTSDSPDIASVDNQGNVKGKLCGVATITAKQGTDSVQIFVVVTRIQQVVGKLLNGQIEKDSGGSLYLSDPNKNVVLKKQGAFASPTPFAGNGVAGSGGDDGDPTKAQLNGPAGVAIDSGGNVYIADSLNHKIRKIEGKKIRTVLGTGKAGLKSELITSDEVSFTCAEDFPLNFPQGIAVDGGQVFIADSDNAAIYIVDFSKKKIKLFAGQPGKRGTTDGKGRTAMFNQPIALNLNASTKVLNVLDRDTKGMTLVRQIAPDGTVKTIKKKATTADEVQGEWW